MTYRDHYRLPEAGEKGWQVSHSWERATRERLTWLYGPDYLAQRWDATKADLAAWRALGRNRPQICVDSRHIHTLPSANETRIGGDSAA